MERTIQKQIQVDGSWVTADVYGAAHGPTIILLPGVMADAAGWAAVAKQVRGWETVVVVNRRGRHPSGPLTESYNLRTEVGDAATVLREFSDVRTVFGWSYGGLIALHLANEIAIPHLIAYEPIMAPFGDSALPALKRAYVEGSLDSIVEIALAQVTGMPGDVIESLRANDALWAGLRDVSAPLPAETHAINEAATPDEFAREAGCIDLIVGERNRGQAPYGTTFEDVARRTPRAAVHQLAGQGHLAHLEAPDQLAALINELGAAAC